MWSRAVRAALVWTKASRWRKGSICKNLIKQAQLHLAIQKNRRDSIIKQSRADIAQFLQYDQLEQASVRVEKLYKDQNLLAAYDQINDFCKCIISNISHISKESTVQSLPISVRRAVASLIFAASRCGELPELHLLRKLFKERYGCEFEIANVELRLGNLVSSQIKQSLCINVVPDDVKLKLISEIADEHTFLMGVNDYEQSFNPQYHKMNSLSYEIEKCESEQKAEVLDLDMQDIDSDNDESWTQASEFETARKIVSHCSSSLSNSKVSLSTTAPRPPYIKLTGTNRSGSSTRIKKNAANVEYPEALSARTSADGMSGTPEMSFVYLDDDLEGKSMIQEYYRVKNASTSLHSWYKISRSAGTNARASLDNSFIGKTLPPEIRYGGRSSKWDNVRRNNTKIFVKDRHSFNGSIDELKMQNDGRRCLRHVHPKLPIYEDIVAELTEHRQPKSFSKYLAP